MRGQALLDVICMPPHYQWGVWAALLIRDIRECSRTSSSILPRIYKEDTKQPQSAKCLGIIIADTGDRSHQSNGALPHCSA